MEPSSRARAFEEVGIEDKSDLHEMDSDLMKPLVAELEHFDAKRSRWP